jgi:hypothetical protein
MEDFAIDIEGPIPGGGNLVARLPVIGATGPFAIELGPTGHDLGGSEDADWILRACATGPACITRRRSSSTTMSIANA